MQKVVSINLNGNAYQLEESGYEALRAYLERAAASLQGSPDRAEIMADIEQAIAEKCARYLGPRKTVVAADEVATIVAEMGPVESAEKSGDAPEAAPPRSESATGAGAPKRLYQISEGAMISGVCNGIAAYFDIDVTIVRVVAVLLAFATFGAAVLVYAALSFIIPYADTSEERAAAYGLHLNARELIEQAQRHHANFKARQQWRRAWQREQRAWRWQWQRQWHRHWRQMEKRMHAGAQATTAPPMGPGAHAVLGLAIPFVAVANAALSVAWILVLLSIFGTGTIFGWPLPPQLPHWGSVLILVAIYFALSAPLRAVRYASHSGWGSPHFAAWGALHGIFWLAFAALFFWLTYQHVPQVHALIDNLLNLWRGSSGSFSVENLARLAHG